MPFFVVSASEFVELFGSRIDELTVLFFPLLKLISLALRPWRDSHTIFVLARKRRAGILGGQRQANEESFGAVLSSALG